MLKKSQKAIITFSNTTTILLHSVTVFAFVILNVVKDLVRRTILSDVSQRVFSSTIWDL
ncbi:MAG TPA: hypothetical protein VGO09_11555 [Flavisolibacter sp.]|nr:hypothetical protein [Flavisolibacter sp.]